MTAFIARRFVASLLILFAASFLMFALMTASGDPLAEFTSFTGPNKELLIQARIDALNLDEPFMVQYLIWLKGAALCLVPGGGCDLGLNLQNQEVTAVMTDALPTTLQLVLAATVLAIVLGVAIGILSAIRQYSTLRLQHHLRGLPLLFAPDLLGRSPAEGLRCDPHQQLVSRAGCQYPDRDCDRLVQRALLHRVRWWHSST